VGLGFYRHRSATKRVGNKTRRYKNLRQFNSECSSRGRFRNFCTLTNLRCTKDGGGLATVKVDSRMFPSGDKPGTWLLHFASCSVMKSHLKKRVIAGRGGSSEAMLRGSRRRRRR
jgi:hypothetical protein